MDPGVLLGRPDAAVTGGDRILAIDCRDPEPPGAGLRPARRDRRRARVPIEPYVSPAPGWAEQDPELYWRALGEACRRVLADPAVRRDASPA